MALKEREKEVLTYKNDFYKNNRTFIKQMRDYGCQQNNLIQLTRLVADKYIEYSLNSKFFQQHYIFLLNKYRKNQNSNTENMKIFFKLIKFSEYQKKIGSPLLLYSDYIKQTLTVSQSHKENMKSQETRNVADVLNFDYKNFIKNNKK